MTERADATPYAGRRATLTTLHGKERAVVPPLARLGLALTTVRLDTDALGTFTGEVERRDTPRATVLAKARLGLGVTGTSLGLATEASFGPHPAVPFAAAHEELLAFIDTRRGIEHVERLVTLRTNYGQLEVASADVPADFLRRARFPGHALIVRSLGGDVPIVKGIRDAAILRAAVAAAVAASPTARARVETDMRADRNPTRLVMIRRLARQLARRLATPCPDCGLPGFGPTGVERGLPCADCGAATPAVSAELLGCLCGRCTRRQPRADGRLAADPATCPECNP